MENDKKTKSSIFIGLAIFLMIIIGGYGFISILRISIESKISYLYNYSQVIASLVSCINLIFIVGFFYSEKSDKRLEEKRINKAHWFNDFMYEKNISDIVKLFDSSLIIVDEVSNINECDYKIFRKRIIKKFNELSTNISNFNNKFTLLIEIVDNELCKDLYQLLEKFEDDLKQSLQDVSNSDNIKKKCTDIVNLYRREFIKKIYDYTMKLY